MLVKDPAGRWQSPRELLRELRRVQQEYCAEGSGEGSGVWESSATMPVDPRLEASRQLAAVMKTGAADAAPRRMWLLLALGLLGAFAVGGALAWLSLRQETLLAVSDSGHVRIPRQPSALAQYYCASQIGTEEAWQSVLQYYPEKESVVRRAKQQLARIYLLHKEYDKALQIFDELAASTDADKEYRAWGLAGKVGALALQGKYAQSADVLNDLWPIRGELRDEQMKNLLDHAVREIRTQLGAQGRQQWDQWLKTQFHHTP